MMWLRDRVRHTPATDAPEVLKQYARCCIMLIIGCWLFPDNDRATTDIAGYSPLMMSWIYQRFPPWCLDVRNVVVFPLASMLNGLRQGNRDTHETHLVNLRLDLDRLGVNEFACTSYDDLAWDALRPPWMLPDEEQRTWRAVVPIVCFMYVRMHHVDRVKRQLGGKQPVPEDPINMDGYLDVSARGEVQWWPTKHEDW
ncbi:hypothetical protein PIB30_050533 [Stylosanthes scabra]|uniref:Aminotransferase-like plant mobile domain-containing protein n=1 Tax=Stylosanthes scabra TaxID=79078 RepID=A0ABU6VGJ0_9FABA|nr:hypothetical protein [Stylosanthes scabra]